MKSILSQIIAANKTEEQKAAEAIQAEINNPTTKADRRNFLKKTALGGISLAGFMGMSMEDTVAHSASRVNRASNPSELKITDMRYAVLKLGKSFSNSRNAIIRIDTNQGIYGLGEVRDGADVRYALMLKNRLLGQNPCNVEMLFKSIKQFGMHGRQGGGVCAVETALWDLAGKAYNVPAWQLLGGRYRDKVRLYSHMPDSGEVPLAKMDMSQFKADIKKRKEEQGFTWIKIHPGMQMYNQIPGTTVNTRYVPGYGSANDGFMDYRNMRHPFTGIQVTEKGLDELAKYVAAVREVIGYEMPMATDHIGQFDINNSIRIGKKLEPYRLAWLEDVVSWEFADQHKRVTDAIETPTITGEDIYLKEEFMKLCDMQAVDIMHPDLGTSGGLLETKKIGDYAEEKGCAMALHHAGSPVLYMANVHSAAATQNFLALEMPNQCVDNAWWKDLAKPTGKNPLHVKGFAPVPDDAPGLGIELNEEVMKQHLNPEDTSFFRPTPEWNEKRSHDRLWS
ncbi:mandelate racemase/muconate lactonizing enzyme family protein [Adhaeribacter aquaticus]|uniref:mandelate racemase/muconate lactonizing enzyme family protein n=1 Tax=Adhaeribacter aquaticus TaxID=299567 RepID=UPI000429ACB5|nr:mandelate racemase/muconate lactonizing enzyme family protein [Adhaeribacter aquaticus]